MNLKTLTLAFCLHTILFATARAQDQQPQVEDRWSQNGVAEHEATSKENRIIKWCKPDGSKARFASANLKIKGYEPCGKLEAVSSCDAVGNRLISKNSKRPIDHKDCGTGPRIVVISHSQPDDGQSGDVEPMTAAENRQLTAEMRAAEKQQENDPEIQLQKAVNQLLTNLLGVDQAEIDRLITGNSRGYMKNGSNKRRNKRNRVKNRNNADKLKNRDIKALIKQFEAMSQHLAPATKEQFEKLLNSK